MCVVIESSSRECSSPRILESDALRVQMDQSEAASPCHNV